MVISCRGTSDALSCVTNDEMDEVCEKRLVTEITRRASAVLSTPNISNEEKKMHMSSFCESDGRSL